MAELPANLEWQGEVPGELLILDQTRLPATEEYLYCRSCREVRCAILALAVRGAPAIGVAAAYAAVLATQEIFGQDDFRPRLEKELTALAETRPTAVNLTWAVAKAREVINNLPQGSAEAIAAALLVTARQIHQEEKGTCLAMGDHGAKLLPPNATVLTHCNAGYLATGGLGTALSVIYRAVAAGKKVEVFADETRPLWQGARLTAWELARSGIPVTVICDNAAGALLATGKVDAVIVGADRVTANGDFANKIGTYPLAVLANRHGIPFYVVAPTSTFDHTLADGSGIPIEQRPAEEILEPYKLRITPTGVAAWNPAFDVTPASLVQAIVTERGVMEPPFVEAIRDLKN